MQSELTKNNRFKNGDLFSTDVTSGASTLRINSASLTDTAYYRCRANNDLGSIYSAKATVVVKGDLNSYSCTCTHRCTVFMCTMTYSDVYLLYPYGTSLTN